MKNQIIKKIMAYLLVGAMVITTPMTASANELENAYSTGTEDGKNTGTGSGSGTSTSTNTATQSVELPAEINKQLPHIVGIALDKTSLEFAELGDTAFVQARALFDDYDAADEEMQWITKDEKQKIEANIHWYSDDFSVASIGSVKNADGSDVTDEDGKKIDGKVGPKAEIKAVGEGTTTIYAWIEADGKEYVNAPQKPTPGDFIATATVTVRGQSVMGIDFDDTQVSWVVKRQYDLTKYTKIILGEGENLKEKTVEQYSGSVVYGLLDPTPLSGQTKAKAKATLTDAGILKITAGQAGEKINFTITTESGYSEVGSVTLIEPVPVSKIEILPDKNAAKVALDMGSVSGFNKDKNRVEKSVAVQLYKKDSNKKDAVATIKDVTDELVWTSNKPAIANVEGNGDKAVIYTAGAVGTAKITVKATSGKSAAFTVTVTATPSKVIPGNATTYTGKKITVPVKLEGENGLNLPVDKKTKLTYAIEDSYAKSNYASVNGKGIISPKDVLYVKGSNNKPDKTQVEPSVDVDVKVTAKYGTSVLTVVPDKAEITIKQSDVQDLTIDTEQFKENKWNKMDGYTLTKDVSKITLDSKGNKPLYVGNTYRFAPKAGEGSSDGALESVTWTPSKKGIVLTSDDGMNYKAEITDNTKSTVKAAYIKLERNANNTYKAKKVTKTITISPVQMAKALIIDKPVQVVQVDKTLHNVKKATTVTVKVKALDPKKSTDKIQWKVLSDIRDANGGALNIQAATAIKNGYAYVNGELQDKDGKPVTSGAVTDDVKNTSIKITIPKDAVAGSVVKVGAYAQGGAVAYAYIYVAEPTKAIEIKESTVGDAATTTKKANGTWSKNNWDLELGKKATITPTLTIDWVEGSEKTRTGVGAGLSSWEKGDTTAYTTEYLTYTLDKKSAQFVRVDEKGTITPIKKGKATITIKTASGKKSAKITINVIAPKASQS